MAPTLVRRRPRPGAAERERGGTWVLRDLGSRNGTALNGAVVTRARLRPGDYVAFAGRTLRVD